MTNLITCNGCGGRKQVAPLGGIMKNCAICEGIGYINQPVIVPALPSLEPINRLDIIAGFKSTDEPSIMLSINPIADEIKAKLSKKKAGKKVKAA